MSAQKEFHFCKTHKMYDFGQYLHCRPNKNGSCSLYEGAYARSRDSQGCDMGYLQVMRGEDRKPLRFKTFDEAWDWARTHRGCS